MLLTEPPLINPPAPNPIDVLFPPVVIPCKAFTPTATLLLLVETFINALPPIPVLKLPELTYLTEFMPTPVLNVPVIVVCPSDK